MLDPISTIFIKEPETEVNFANSQWCQI